jgi:4-hydroxythreonine-4-phosphate dehydrogenase
VKSERKTALHPSPSTLHPSVAITLGDPAGIGPEIVARSLDALGPDAPLLLFGNFRMALEGPGAGTYRGLPRFDSASAVTTLPAFLDVGRDSGAPLRHGVIDASYGAVALESIQAALAAIDSGICSSLVTAPIQKQSIAAAGSPFPGHTELLAAHSGLERYGRDYAMYFDSPSLRVALLSVHLPLRAAIDAIRPEGIADIARLIDREYRKMEGAAPRIGVAGLNPHAGDGGMFGDEEERIRAGVALAAADGLTISGPAAADTIFRSARSGKYDVVIAMYHDQGLIPVKTLHFDESVNVTLGLPYLRCSVDHGTAFDIAGRGIADAGPMTWAIRYALQRVGRVG